MRASKHNSKTLLIDAIEDATKVLKPSGQTSVTGYMADLFASPLTVAQMTAIEMLIDLAFECGEVEAGARREER